MEKHLDLNVLRAVKLFLWKVGNDLLATKKNLFCKKIIEDPSRPICFKGEESVMHILWQCPAANNIRAEG